MLAPQLAMLFALTTGIGFLMILSGVGKKGLEWTRRRRLCPSCGREVHEGLQVIENWNGANTFIYYGKGGEIATNRRDDQELAVHCMALVQNALVFVNTLMIQRVLAAQDWMRRMTPEDLRGLTPLIYAHVNPYGVFRLDLSERLALEEGGVEVAG